MARGEQNQTQVIRNIVIAGLVLLVLGLSLWTRAVFMNPERTFWAMLDSGLQTQSVTRSIQQTGPNGSLQEYLQLQLGQVNAVRGRSTIEQKDQKGNSSRVVTETIGTPDANYSEYIDIMTSEKAKNGSSFNFDSIKNIWGKDNIDANNAGQSIFSEMLYGVIPFGNLPADKRQELLDYISTQKVYDVDFANAKRETLDGKSVYRYGVSVKPSTYIAMLQKYDQMLGLKQLEKVDPSAYEQSPAIQLEVVVAINSRELLQVKYSDGSRQEDYSSYGSQNPIVIPDSAMPRAEIDKKLQKLLQ
jgi:hypothetical protein